MSDEIAPPAAAAPTGKMKFIREMIGFLTGDRAVFYSRGDTVYIDTSILKGNNLLPLEGSEFRSFILKLAKVKDDILLRGADAELIVDHCLYHAKAVATPLSADPRSCMRNGVLWINPAWPDQRLIRIADGAWEIVLPKERIFAPLPSTMSMPVPVPMAATEFPKLVAKGITSFGDYHCFYCTTLATMLMPADDVHPIIILSGEGAKGKTTTMKLSTQLVDPDEGNECMIVGEDQRDILVACLTRKTLGLDNASKLPIGDDLLSQMFAGGVSKERKLHTNNEQATIKIGRMRVFINGVSPDFSKSDFFTKAIFLEQPVVTKKNAAGKERFDSLSAVEGEWKALLPQVLGALLSVIAEGLPHYTGWLERRRTAGRRPDAAVRFVEFAVMGESFARAMGFPADTFTQQVEALSDVSKQTAVSSDECAQLLLLWAEGKRGADSNPFADSIEGAIPKQDRYEITTGALHGQMQELAKSEGYNTYKMPWLNNPIVFGRHLRTTIQTLNNSSWLVFPKGRNGAGWIIERKEN